MTTQAEALEEINEAIDRLVAMAGYLQDQTGVSDAEKVVARLMRVREFIDPSLTARLLVDDTVERKTHERGTDLAAPDSPRSDEA